jgi:hypothetical protein
MRISNQRVILLEKTIATGSTGEHNITLRSNENAILSVLPTYGQDVKLTIADTDQPEDYHYAQKSNWSTDPRVQLNTTRVKKNLTATWTNSSGSSVACVAAIVVGLIQN